MVDDNQMGRRVYYCTNDSKQMLPPVSLRRTNHEYRGKVWYPVAVRRTPDYTCIWEFKDGHAEAWWEGQSTEWSYYVALDAALVAASLRGYVV